MRLCVLVRMQLPEPLEQWEDVRAVFRPRGDVHLTVAFYDAVKVTMSAMGKSHMKGSGSNMYAKHASWKS